MAFARREYERLNTTRNQEGIDYTCEPPFTLDIDKDGEVVEEPWVLKLSAIDTEPVSMEHERLKKLWKRNNPKRFRKAGRVPLDVDLRLNVQAYIERGLYDCRIGWQEDEGNLVVIDTFTSRDELKRAKRELIAMVKDEQNGELQEEFFNAARYIKEISPEDLQTQGEG